MGNSSLVDYIKISPYKTVLKDKVNRKIGVHHMAGNLTVEICGEVFQKREASSHYGIGTDGRVGMYVDEKDRSWSLANKQADMETINIEVANDVIGGNWHVSDKALAKLIDLCVDICQRNEIDKLDFTGDKNGNLVMHKYYVSTVCPGPYLESKFPYIADEVNKRLQGKDIAKDNTSDNTLYKVQVGAFERKANAEKLQAQLKDLGYDTYIVQVDNMYKVQIGAFSEKSNAENLLNDVKSKGFDAFVTTISDEVKISSIQKKSLEEIAKEVLHGEWGNGNERKERLKKEGYTSEEISKIQEIVNSYY